MNRQLSPQNFVSGTRAVSDRRAERATPRIHRYAVDLPVAFGNGATDQVGRCTSLTLDGMFIVSDAPAAAGTVLDIWLTLSDGRALLVKGRVVRTDRDGFLVEHATMADDPSYLPS